MGLAAACLGWRPTEFYDATPAEFFAALEQWRAINCPS
ncbi:phage tail assembly chaperone [Sphingomonas bacterium]